MSFLTAFTTAHFKTNDWYVDSGASNCHMCHEQTELKNFSRLQEGQSVAASNGQTMEASGRGDYEVDLKGGNQSTLIKDVMCVPSCCQPSVC